jgi:hypothetical protein
MSFAQTPAVAQKVSRYNLAKADPRWLAWLMALVVWAQALYVVPTTIYWTLRSIHPIPFWDAWVTVTFLKSGQPLLGWLWSQHNEHRILIPKLISLIDYRWFQGCGYFDLTLIWSMQIGAALLLTSLSFEAIGRGVAMRPWRVMVCGLIVCLTFSAAQMENFYWPFQTGFIGMGFFSVLALICLKRAIENSNSVAWIAGGALVAMASALSLSGGMLTVVIFAAAAWLVARIDLRQLLVVELVLLAFAVAYLCGYQTPVGQGVPIEALRHPVLIFQYFFVYLGNVWINQTTLAAIVGSWGLELFLLAILFTSFDGLLHRSRRSNDDPANRRLLEEPVTAAPLVLLLIGVLIVGQDFITALGRYVIGIEQALSSRYITPVSFFWIATLVLILGLILKRQLSLRFVVAHCALILMMVAQVTVRDSSLGKTFALRFIILERAANALRVGVVDNRAFAEVFPNPEVVSGSRTFLLERRLSVFSDNRYAWLGRQVSEVATTSSPDACLGYFELVSYSGVQDGAKVTGWAWSKQENKSPPHLLLADDTGKIVGLASGGLERADVVAKIAEVTKPSAGWQGYSKYAHAVSAYALINGDREACRLQGSFDITATAP